MKKFILGLVVNIILVTSGTFAASSIADLSSGPADPAENVVAATESTTEEDTSVRRIKPEANLYYNEGDDYRNYQRFGNCTEDGCEDTSRSVRAEIKRASDERKYHIFSPFFQPREMQFTSVTDLSYRINSLDFEILPGTGPWQNNTGEYKYSGMSVTENLSFGINDELTVIGALQYTSAELEINWDTVVPPYDKDKDDSSKIDMFGIGLQWRFVNNNDWIGTLLGAYQNLEDTASVMTLDTKLGYKIDNSTIYGFGRGYFLSWENTGYGFGLTNQYNQTEVFMLDDNAEVSFYSELGLGLFSALDSNWSTDVSLVYSYGEWHSQVYGRAAISYQPVKNIAVSLYGKFAVIDTADGFNESTVFYQDNVTPATIQGTAEFSNYSDTVIGLQVGVLF